MRVSAALHSLFNTEITDRLSRGRYTCVVLQPAQLKERQAMNRQIVMAALRRDVNFIGNALVAVVFIGFASLALAATVFDLIAIRH